jgi:hypothetical protein
MSNLLPDPDRSGRQISQNAQNSNDLYFQDLIDQQKKLLSATTDLDDYNKRLAT